MQKFRQDQFVNFVTAFDIDKNRIYNDIAMHYLMNLAKISSISHLTNFDRPKFKIKQIFKFFHLQSKTHMHKSGMSFLKSKIILNFHSSLANHIV